MIEKQVEAYRGTGAIPLRLTENLLRALTRKELRELYRNYRGGALSGSFTFCADLARFQTRRLKRIMSVCHERGIRTHTQRRLIN